MKKLLCIYFFIQLLITSSPFKFKFSNIIKRKPYNKFFLENRFRPVKEEKTITIKHKNKLFKLLNKNVYAQVGSNPKYMSNYESYVWLDGDGMIHSIYFNSSSITYQNKWIETKKFSFENKMKKKIFMNIGNFYDHNGMFNFLMYSLKTILKMIPNVKGTANTALFETNNRLFALYEGDMPYELEINNKTFNITTKSYLELANASSLTAHPIKDEKRNLNYLYSYNNYDWKKGNFIFNVFDKNMSLIAQKNISLINNGITHSITKTENKIIVADMPMKFDFFKLLKFEQPLYYDKFGITRFGVFDVDKMDEPEWYYFKENFFIFHFSTAFETEFEYIIYACVNKDLNLKNMMNFDGIDNNKKENSILREIRINKRTKNTCVIGNRYLETLENVDFPYFLDFPQSSIKDKNIIYSCIFDAKKAYIKGVFMIDTNNFTENKPDIFLFPEGVFGTAEFQPVTIKNKEYLLGFIDDNNKHKIALIDVKKKKIESIEIPTRIPPGFHSLFFKV